MKNIGAISEKIGELDCNVLNTLPNSLEFHEIEVQPSHRFCGY